jgi:hypothetical protein
MMKTTTHILICALLPLCWGCQDNFADDVYTEPNHVRFEFYDPSDYTPQPIPSDNVLDSYSLRLSQLGNLSIPVVLSWRGERTSVVTVQLTVSSSQLAEGAAFTITTPDADPADKLLVFETGDLTKEVLFFPVSGNVTANSSVVFELSSASDESVHLGLPGTRAIRKKFVLSVLP